MMTDENNMAYNSNDVDNAKWVQEGVVEVLKNIPGVEIKEITEEQEKSGKPLGYIGVRITTEDEDWLRKRGDIVITSPDGRGHYHIDTTSARSYKVLNEKRQNAEEFNLIVAKVYPKTLERALGGSERDKKIIAEVIFGGIKDFIERKKDNKTKGL